MTLFNFSSLPCAFLGASAFFDYLQVQGSKHGKSSFKCGIRSLPRVIPPFLRVNSFVGMVLWVPKRVSVGFFAQRCRTPVGQMIIFGKDPAGGNKLVS
jgi:hypothetical protein